MNRSDRPLVSRPWPSRITHRASSRRGVGWLGAIGLLSLLIAGTAEAQSLKPSWTCVPEDTVLLVRMPNGQAFFEALRDRTKLGSVVVAHDRLEKILGVAEESSPEEWTKLQEGLARYQLKLDDLKSLFTGETGMSLSLQPRGEKPPRPMLLAWFEPGGDLPDRLYAALQKAVEEAEGPMTPKRIDFDLAGHSVMRLAIPTVDRELGEDFFERPDFEKLTPEQIQQWYKQREEKIANAKLIEVDRSHVLLARKGSRILIGATFGGGMEIRQKMSKGEKVDLDEETGLAELTAAYARFLTSHDDGSSGPQLRAYETPGLSAALPAGAPLLEAIIDPRPFFKLLDEAKEGEKAKKTIAALGFNDLGPVAMRMSLDGTQLKTSLFVSVPAPRHGLLAMLDQAPLAPEPPAWVPSSVMQYAQFGFDLGKAYTSIKEVINTEFGARAEAGFQMAEAQVNAQLQTDITSLLSSVGQQHICLAFTPQKNTKMAEAHPDLPMASTNTNRTAFVWQTKSEDVWKRVIEFLAKLSAADVQEEQGFSGIRTPESMMSEGGLFVGQGYLVLGIGEDVIESTIVALRNPPTGDAALLTSPLYRRATELLPPQPAMAFSFTDMNRVVKSLYDNYRDMIEQMKKSEGFANDASPDAARNKLIFEKVIALIPTAEEIDGTFGVRVTQTVVDDQGLTLRSVDDLPPAR